MVVDLDVHQGNGVARDKLRFAASARDKLAHSAVAGRSDGGSRGESGSGGSESKIGEGSEGGYELVIVDIYNADIYPQDHVAKQVGAGRQAERIGGAGGVCSGTYREARLGWLCWPGCASQGSGVWGGGGAAQRAAVAASTLRPPAVPRPTSHLPSCSPFLAPQAIDVAEELRSGAGDATYLAAVERALRAGFERCPCPDLVVFNAGTDILEVRPALRRLAVSLRALASSCQS
jgi:hypothetical protein